VVVWSAVVSTTVKADNINLKYILYIKEIDYLAVSDMPWNVYQISNGSTYNRTFCIGTKSGNSFKNLKYNLDTQSFIGGEMCGTPTDEYEEAYSFYTLDKWIVKITGVINSQIYSQTGTISNGKINDYTIYTNSEWTQDEISKVKSYNTDLTGIIGEGLTEEKIIEIINNSINETTNTTIEANTIQTNINNYYTQYKNGDITREEMQQYLNEALTSLKSLNDTQGNTLSDLMAINNALTYAQTIQQELLLKPATSVTTSVQTILTAVSNLVQQYQNRTVTQAQAMQELRGYAYQLAQLMNGELSVSDVEVINAGTNVVNNFIEIISNNSELKKDVSELSQKSDKDELDFIESIETEKSIEDLAPSKIYLQGQSATADNNNGGETITDLFQAVWNNALVKILIPIFAGFSIVAVVLGRKYKL
jgi:hypothetical protein